MITLKKTHTHKLYDRALKRNTYFKRNSIEANIKPRSAILHPNTLRVALRRLGSIFFAFARANSLSQAVHILSPRKSDLCSLRAAYKSSIPISFLRLFQNTGIVYLKWIFKYSPRSFLDTGKLTRNWEMRIYSPSPGDCGAFPCPHWVPPWLSSITRLRTPGPVLINNHPLVAHRNELVERSKWSHEVEQVLARKLQINRAIHINRLKCYNRVITQQRHRLKWDNRWFSELN